MAELDAFSIRVSTSPLVKGGVRLVVKVEGENVAIPPTSHNETAMNRGKQQQPFHYLPNSESSTSTE